MRLSDGWELVWATAKGGLGRLVLLCHRQEPDGTERFRPPEPEEEKAYIGRFYSDRS